MRNAGPEFLNYAAINENSRRPKSPSRRSCLRRPVFGLCQRCSNVQGKILNSTAARRGVFSFQAAISQFSSNRNCLISLERPSHSKQQRDTGETPLMSIARLRDFVAAMTRLVEHQGNAEDAVLEPARDLLSPLVAHDDWLPDPFAACDPARYRQYLLYGDPLDRFSLVSFVWGPGQRTPVHDHLMWGLVGMLRGVEEAVPYTRQPGEAALTAGEPSRLQPRMIQAVSWGHPHCGECTTRSTIGFDPSLWRQYRYCAPAWLRSGNRRCN